MCKLFCEDGKVAVSVCNSCEHSRPLPGFRWPECTYSGPTGCVHCSGQCEGCPEQADED